MRHLTLLALGGILGSFLLAGNAEACHKKQCQCAAPVVCAPAPVVCVQPAPPPRPVKIACAPKVKKCGGGGLLAKLFHKKTCAPAACATPVAYVSSYPTVTPSGQYMSTPQATRQSMGMPQVPSKSMGTPQVPGKSMGTPQG
jgi:hypothetical protein